MKEFNWFKWVSLAVFVIFCGIMVAVVTIAKSRRFSGVTGVDAGQIQQMRVDADAAYRQAKSANQPYQR